MSYVTAIDIETKCAVKGCVDYGKSICRNDHSLSPWQGEITKIALWQEPRHESFAYPQSRVFNSIEEFKAWFPDPKRLNNVVGQNFKFDLLWLWVHGYELPLENWIGDSQLAAFVLSEKIPDHWLFEYEVKRKELGGHHRPVGKHSLKSLAPYFLGVEPFWEPADGNLDDPEYVLKDAQYTAQLVVELEEKLKSLGQYEFYKNKQLPWTKMLLMAEWRGVQLDTEAMERMVAKLSLKSEELKEKLDWEWSTAHIAYKAQLKEELRLKYAEQARSAIARLKPDRKGYEAKVSAAEERCASRFFEAAAKLPVGVDYDSPSQMAWLLRDYLGYDISSLEGKDSTAAEVLERLAGEGHGDVATYLQWRETNKILTAFLPSYQQLAVPDTIGGAADSRSGDASVRGLRALHPIYNPTGTRTGRLSAERPNVQQMPGSLKPLFRARAGYSFVGFDEAAIEARLIALYTEDKNLYDILATGQSFHDHNVKGFFGYDTPTEQVKKAHPKEREATKNVGFALFYGGGGNRIRIAFAQKGFLLSEDTCQRLFKGFKARFPQAFAYKDSFTKYMEEGNVVPNLLGRPVHIENPEDAYMKGFNKLIQGSASDLVLDGAYKAWQQAKEEGLDAHPILFVHDYVGFEVKDEHVEKFENILRLALTNFDLQTSHGPIALEVEGGVAKRWEK